MKYYIATNGEIIEPVQYGSDIYDPADPPRAAVVNDVGEEVQPAYPGTLLHGKDEWVPIEERYTPEFVATLREYDPETEPNPPEREPPAQPPRTVDQAMAQRNAALDYASQQINPLQDLVDIGEATGDDEALLLLWKKYRAAVGKVNTQSGWHLNVNWPVPPEV